MGIMNKYGTWIKQHVYVVFVFLHYTIIIHIILQWFLHWILPWIKCSVLGECAGSM